MKKPLLFYVLFFVLIATTVRAQSWVDVGSAEFTAGEADYVSITFGKNDTPYVAYEDLANNDGPTVMKFNGTSWVGVGAPGFTGNVANFTSIAIDSSGRPFVIYQDASDTQKASVMMYNGSSWVSAGAPGISSGVAAFTALALSSSDTLFAVFTDQADSGVPRMSVMKYNDSNWVNVGPPRFSPITTNGAAIAIFGNTPYITFPDSSIVQVYNGSNWVPVGAPSPLASAMQSMSLAIDNTGTPYVAYSDNTNGFKATVIKYNGTAWVVVGSAGFSTGEADNVTIAIDGSGTPYVVYADAGTPDSYATVKKFDGTNWVTVGSSGFSGTLDDFNSIAINGAGVPYVFYQGFAGGQKGTVEKFDATTGITAPRPSPKEREELRVFPNPTTGSFTINITAPGLSKGAECTITITNMLGEKVKEFTAATNADIAVQVDGVPGVYFVTAVTSQGVVGGKVVVE